MKKISSRSNITKKAQALTPTAPADILYAIAGGDKSGAMTGALSDLIKNNPKEFGKAFSTLDAAEKLAVTDRMNALGFRPAGTTMPISFRTGAGTLTRAAPTVAKPPATPPTGVKPPIEPPPVVKPPINPPPAAPAVETVAAGETAAGAATATEAATFTAAGVGSIAAAAAALLAYPKIGQLIYGGIDEDQLKTSDPSDVLRTGLIRTVQSYWQPIIECDVADWDYGGDLSDIADYENARIIKNYADILYASTTSTRMRDYALKEITLDNIARELANAEDQSGGSWAARFIVGARDDRSFDMIKKSPCVAKGVSDFTGWVAQYIAAVKSHDPILAAKNSGGGSGSGGGTGGGNGGGGGAKPEGGPGLDYPGASKVMMEKGYIGSIENDWTPAFDKGFRAFIDAASRGAENIPDTNLVSGQTWGEVAGELGFASDARGGILAVKRMARFIGGKEEKPVQSGEPKQTKETEVDSTSTGKVDVLADMISMLYNDKLVEGGGFLSYEKKQTQSIVDAVGGAGPSGYNSAAKVLLARNPQLQSVIPEKIDMPVTKKSIKGTPLFGAFKMVQQTIHSLYEAANPGMINPGQAKATENVKKFLDSPAGGNWKGASFSRDRFVKLGEERKERIRAKIAAELTPAERAEMRRLKMRGA